MRKDIKIVLESIWYLVLPVFIFVLNIRYWHGYLANLGWSLTHPSYIVFGFILNAALCFEIVYIFGTAALRPEAVCADGFTLSIQASGMHYCIPNEDLSDGNYSKVELSYLSEEVEEFLPFAEDDEAPLATVYGYVPVETVDAVLAKHGGIVNA